MLSKVKEVIPVQLLNKYSDGLYLTETLVIPVQPSKALFPAGIIKSIPPVIVVLF